MSESADDLSKSDEISLNQDASPNQDENSPNFTDTYNAWHEMLETENRGVAGRVADLERKVLEQGDELVCLKFKSVKVKVRPECLEAILQRFSTKSFMNLFKSNASLSSPNLKHGSKGCSMSIHWKPKLGGKENAARAL
ncbi:hypothetical protein HUJ04_006013 [Dendroctonus ponderosae]|nr:hypothetical protein HUJ04_006013 [Dendroctonus ponderosae]